MFKIKHSEEMDKIAQALAKAQAKMPKVNFDSKNPFFRSKYASLGANIDGTVPQLNSEGISVVQGPFGDIIYDDFYDEKAKEVLQESRNVIGVETLLLHESGQWISSSVSIVAPREKNPAQTAGGIITYLRRYALAAMLCRYAEEDTDGEELVERKEAAKVTRKARKPQGSPTGAKVADNAEKPKGSPSVGTENKRPYKPEQVVEALQIQAKMSPPASDKQVTFLASLIGQVYERKGDRHEVQEYLFGKKSLKDVDKKMVNAGIRWLNPEDGVIDKTAHIELTSIYPEVQKQKGQMTLDDEE